MGIGSKIKEFRIKSNLTQKDLADKLFVTYQAVSRWEKDDAEPSYDTLRQMCKIFNCTTDELFCFSEDKEENIERQIDTIDEVNENSEISIQPIINEVKPLLAVCEMCNKPIYESNEINRIEIATRIRRGRSYSKEVKQKLLCTNCNKKRITLEEENKRKARDLECEKILRKRHISLIVSSIVAVLFIALSIYFFINKQLNSGLGWLILSVVGFTFIGTLILDNTFIADLWGDIASWGFVKMPGLIISLDFDGIKFLIVAKIIFALLGLLLSISSLILATLIAGLLSIIVYPIALYLNAKEIKELKNA